MPMQQGQRFLRIQSPLGENALLLTGFQGVEEMSKLFRFQLDLISDSQADIAPAMIVGQNVTFSMEIAEQAPRFFNGIVSRFHAGDEDDQGVRRYRAEVVPWLWLLTQTADCRVFQQKSVPEIVEQIFGDAGFQDYEMKASGSHPKWDYCVQYRETDFNFISRLMEHEGLFYFFRHENGKHTLVVADSKAVYQDCRENEVSLPPVSGERNPGQRLTAWEHQYAFRPGKWSQTDYNFETPTANMATNAPSKIKMPGMDKFEIYDYPGEYEKRSEGDADTKLRMEADEAAHEVVHGASECKTFMVGGKFKVAEHRAAAEEGKSYVLTSLRHDASETLDYATGGGAEGNSGTDYFNQFECIPDKVIARPLRTTPKPTIQGVQTAVVVGPPGEEIYPDKYGRVKVQFHWDREGKRDENSSCWIRVSQPHAGMGFGGIDIPRIGQEVIVDFLEGDPDRPIITGRVYNAQNMPPFPLPDEKTRSGMKSQTHKGAGYNEITLDDTQGKEQIRIHGQYNMDTVVEHDETHTIHNNRTKAVDVDETMTIGNNQQLKVGVDKTVTVGANHTESVGSNQKVTVGANQNVSVGANQSVSVGSSQSNTVGMAKTEMVGITSNEMVGAMKSTNVGVAYSIISGAAMNTAVGFISAEEVGMTKKIVVGSKLEIIVGSSKLTMDAGGKVTIEGVEFLFSASGNVKINGAIIDLN